MSPVDRLRSSPLLGRAETPLGYGLLAIGGLLMVLPGPGLPFVLGGLALLSRRQPWARRAHGRLMRGIDRVLRREPGPTSGVPGSEG